MSHMLREIRSQGDAWAAALETVDAVGDDLGAALRDAVPSVLMVGAGSSYYLGLAARGAWVRAGLVTSVAPASEAVLHPELYPLPEGGVLLGVSRSGTTTETLRALSALRNGGVLVVGVTTTEGTPIEAVADFTVSISGAAEYSTVQTRSFSAQLIAVLALAALARGDEAALAALRRLPAQAAGFIARAETAMMAVPPTVERVYVLGTGDLWGLAMEGALKLKETSLTESEAFQTLEFRHGPQSMVDESTLVVGLLSDDPAAQRPPSCAKWCN